MPTVKSRLRSYADANPARVGTLGLVLGAIGAMLFGAASFGVGLGAVQAVLGGMLALICLVLVYLSQRGGPPRRDVANDGGSPYLGDSPGGDGS